MDDDLRPKPTLVPLPNALPGENVEGWLKKTKHTTNGASKAKTKSPFEWTGVSQIFAPLPPTKWIVPGLQLCPGRVATIAAFGSSGKTLACQSMLTSLAAGLPVWGKFEGKRPIQVRHVDHEQGRHATFKRYQRLAFGLRIDASWLGDRLHVSTYPPVYLNDLKSIEEYAKVASDGVELVVIDSLRASMPGEDENDSKIRRFLDALSNVSDRTGCAFLLLHHAGKSRSDGSSDKRMTGRGTGAIFDASGLQLVFEGEASAPKLVTMTKPPAEAEGRTLDPFYLAIEDVADGSNPTAGVKVTYQTVESIKPMRDPSTEFDALLEQVRACVREHPGIAGKAAIRARINTRQNLTVAAVAELEARGEIVNDGTAARPRYRLRLPQP